MNDTPKIAIMPANVKALSAAEVDALQELVPLAEALSLDGSERAGVAMDWMRDLLNSAKQID